MTNGEKDGKKSAQGFEVKIIPMLPAKLGRVYSNFAEISQSPFDFTIRFCDAPPGTDIHKLKKGNEVEVPTVVEVVLPVGIIPGLINALTDQNKKYLEAHQVEKNHGKDK